MKKLNGIKILVIDDDPDLRTLISDEFSMEGAVTETCESGKSAMTLIKERAFDIIISDMRMPNGDGMFVARSLLEIKKPKPLLFIYSGYNELTSEECSALEICGVFSKPFILSEMTDSILEKLNERKSV